MELNWTKVLEEENAKLKAQVKELQDHPLIEIRADGEVRGHNCAGCAGLEVQLKIAHDALRKVKASTTDRTKTE